MTRNANEINGFRNFGDVDPWYGQLWIKPGPFDDCAEFVETLSGEAVGCADNQARILRGSIYINPDHWDSALDVIGLADRIGPPEMWQVAVAFHAYSGGDVDSETIVQVGRDVDPYSGPYDTPDRQPLAPDVVLHGNSSLSRYLERNFLDT